MKMSPKFILRFDDISPGMAWSKFLVFEELLTELNIKPLLGVVPQCLDPELTVEPENEQFWDQIRSWSSIGWVVAQHGHTHQYQTQNAGILAVNKNSEFAGLSYPVQVAKLAAGKDIMVREGVWKPIFMAPSHSFDEVTLQALESLGFKYITDGYGVYPYNYGSLTALPQLFASPFHFGFGVYTICLHVNNMSISKIRRILSFIRTHPERFVSFENAVSEKCSVPLLPLVSRVATAPALRFLRALRRVC